MGNSHDYSYSYSKGRNNKADRVTKLLPGRPRFIRLD